MRVLSSLMQKRKWKSVIYIFICWVMSFFVFTAMADEQKVVVRMEAYPEPVEVNAETALTPVEQMTGLMYRAHLDEKDGMIFIFPYPKVMTMWMKNTYISLDMIFFNEQGVVTHIHKYATPLDLTSISSVVPAIGVLEVNAGFVDRYGVQVGQKISYPPLKARY